MVTMICDANVSETTRSTQNETLPSDFEISRRVHNIQSRWSVGERRRRRDEAEARFADLLVKLIGGPEAA